MSDPKARNIPEADINNLNPSSIEFLHSYTGIPTSEIPDHVLSIRNKALSTEVYRCIDRFGFLGSKIANMPYTSTIMNLLENGATLCDAGCCFGTDIRILHFQHHIPAAQLYAFDLERNYLDAGYELFRDRETFKGNYTTGNVLIPNDPNLSLWDGKMDIVTANAFLHVFNLRDQTIAAERLVRLTKGKGSLICGRQVGSPNARSNPMGVRPGDRYLHNPESMKKFWQDAGEQTGTKWDVESGFIERNVGNPQMEVGRKDDTALIWWKATRLE